MYIITYFSVKKQGFRVIFVKLRYINNNSIGVTVGFHQCGEWAEEQICRVIPALFK